MEPFIAQIILFAGNFAPRNWAFCDGQLLAISSNTALFSLLGTTYGGDGRTTFALPDLRGRGPVHSGSGAGPGLNHVNLGERSGNPTTTLNSNNLPSHTHTANVTNALRIACHVEAGNADDPDGAILSGGLVNYSTAAPDGEMNSNAIAGVLSVTNSNTGNNTAFSNMQPYLGLNYIIALQGTFPSRS